MAEYQQFLLPKKYHDAMLGWQKSNFPDLGILQSHWSKFFPGEPEFNLAVKVAPMNNSGIEVGIFKGQPKLTRAGDMKGNMLYSALRVIKAQCSTELGSIQQHLCTLDTSPCDQSKFSVLRIMAEELRHAYQMFWVLSNDSSWSEAGVRNLADETMDELLSMETGTHMLDAFNIPFSDALDSIVFAFLVDRVGKYQLSMQQVFSYAPMAQSMLPMLHEESFHLKAGNEFLKSIAVAAVQDKGAWSLADIQKRLNAWFPRAIEMFGNSEGGQTNIDFGFKNQLNGESARAYIAEVDRLIRRINLEIGTIMHPEASRAKLEMIIDNQEDMRLLRLPHTNFFRIRGSDAISYRPFDVSGHPISIEIYKHQLHTILPAALQNTEFFRKYWSTLITTNTPIG